MKVKKSEKVPPNPGSDAALDRGCTCAVLDNHHGRGFPWEGETTFWITQGCPLHAPEPEKKP